MIQLTDIRIGNLVSCNDDGSFLFIKTIDEQGSDVFNQTESTWIEHDGLSGIPLTEEWMKHCEFEELHYGSDKFGWIKDGVNISKYFNFVLMLPNAEYYDSTKVKFVHELQNLYYTLTGTELKIFPLKALEKRK